MPDSPANHLAMWRHGLPLLRWPSLKIVAIFVRVWPYSSMGLRDINALIHTAPWNRRWSALAMICRTLCW